MTTLLFAIVALAAPAPTSARPSPGAPHATSRPSTQPTTQPTTQPSAPRADERVVEDATLHFHFAVPKLWKDVPQQASSAYVFSLPAVGESRRYAPSMIVTARDTGDGTLASEVEARRAAIAERNAGVKFDEDAAATVAGHDGWLFAYITTLNQTVTEKPSGKQHIEKISIQVRDEVVLIDGRALEFVLTSDDKGMTIRRKQVDRVLQTLAVDQR